MHRHVAIPSLLFFALLGLSAGPAWANPHPWQVINTANFRVLHLDQARGEQVAKAAELWREKIARVWHATPAQWKVRCDLYLFRDNAELVRMTGGGHKLGSALALQSRLMGGKVYRRRINLAADDHGLLESTLPHEVAHVVLKDLVRRVPRWADEGLAMSVESQRSQRRRVLALRHAVTRGPFYRAETLMNAKRYPEREYIHLYYAQSYALTRFFIERGGATRFIGFLNQLRLKGARRALWDTYRFGDFATLQRLYLDYCRTLVRAAR